MKAGRIKLEKRTFFRIDPPQRKIFFEINDLVGEGEGESRDGRCATDTLIPREALLLLGNAGRINYAPCFVA